MSKLADKLRECKIHNNHNLLSAFGEKGKDVSVDYAAGWGRGSTAHNRTKVLSPSFKTDPNSAWYDYGNKTFSGNRKKSFPEALEWATKTYGITEWATSPFGGHVPKYIMDKAKAFLKEKDNAKSS